MSVVDPRIAQLALEYGILAQFRDSQGQTRDTPEATLLAILRALGVDTTAHNWVDAALAERRDHPWRLPLPPCVVAEQNQEEYVNVHVTAGSPAVCRVILEDGSAHTLEQVENLEPDREVDGRLIGRATFRLPTWFPPGYHKLTLDTDDETHTGDFILTPTWVGTPRLGTESVWGFMAQLYSVTGQASWGVGDLGDLADLCIWSKTAHNADFILINPLHAAEMQAPMEPSPYLPTTRRYINPLYIRPELIEEYATASPDLRTRVRNLRFRANQAARATELIRRDPVWQAKLEALRLVHEAGLSPVRQMEMEAYWAREGDSLRRFAIWCLLTERLGQEWTAWPAGYQNPSSPEVADFAAKNVDEIDFYMWLQWVADAQAARAQAKGLSVGMKVGVMSDLAVGIHQQAEETWARPYLFAHGVTVGAPPDDYNPSGQDWQQPPWRPDRLEASSYAPWRAMIASLLHQGGGLRVDHILGLFRLWWIPAGMRANDGAYVKYDHQALIGILALEALRAEALVVGEDLGTTEPWVREYLARRGILGTSVLWFEYGDDGRPLNPCQWRTWCLGSVTTHDLPPTLGYLEHDHVRLRHELGLLTDSFEDELARDAHRQEVVRDELAATGLINPGETDPHQIMLGLYRFLVQTPAKLKCVALTDAVGEKRIQNQPGTVDEYPNWRIPLGDGSGHRLILEDIYQLASVQEVADVMNGRA